MWTEDDVVNSLATELVDEAVGASRRKWLLVLVALVLGAGLTLWILRRAATANQELADEETTAAA